ncbi:MAG TPA: hypothetical protein VF587_16415 [Solirubrobacteraceae bacterium]
MAPVTALPRRARLARTLERSRWGEYEALLRRALDRGYDVVGLERWVLGEPLSGRPTLILRHDVDQRPASALRVAALEERLGVAGTWYFRWRTAHPAAVAAVRRAGGEVGLHYETLTRHARAAGVATATPAMVEAARETLAAEVAAFGDRFGPVTSICAHGDTAVPGVRNLDLLEGQDPERFGVRLDANFGVRGRRLAGWLTDRSVAAGRWKEGLDPARLLDDGASPILVVMHPNNWTSGPALWADRLLARVPVRVAGRPMTTGSDEPPL